MRKLLLFGATSLFLWNIFSGMSFAATPDIQISLGSKIIRPDFTLNPELITTTTEHVISLGPWDLPVDISTLPKESLPFLKTQYHTKISEAGLTKFLTNSGLLLSNNTPSINISQTDDTITFSGSPISGYDIPVSALTDLLDQALFQEYPAHIYPGAEARFSTVQATPELMDKGIQEVLAIGKSNFAGSSNNRRKNIEAAAKIYNGTIVPSGKEFSFNALLEPKFSEEFGFTKELVIKGNELEAELGGGVCQVSTTAFRAAYQAGLEITARRPHSFAVPYYSPHGFDAMVYFGVSDMKFRNDTPGDILIQTEIQNDELLFVFYGTPDDRQVTIEGPYVSNYKATPDPQIIETTLLKPGEEDIANPSYRGFDAKWLRHITKNGTTETQELMSYYRSFPAKIYRGTEPEAEIAEAQPVGQRTLTTLGQEN